MSSTSPAVPATLEPNLRLLTEAETKIALNLVENGQAHVFERWPAPGTDDVEKKSLLAQVDRLDGQYPGGLAKYGHNSRDLLENARLGINPYDGWTPSVPLGTRLINGTAEFNQMEALGLQAIQDTAFVLVAGGLGERLGYKGIKLALPSELSTESCFLEYYCEFILALQARARETSGDKKLILPLAIMTSDDTHAQTELLLSAHNNFKMEKGQILLMKQEMVPALMDNEARIALDPANPYKIITKPHGHGDVHLLIAQNHLAEKWAGEGRKWVVFFQDTNGLVFRALIAALGTSVAQKFEVNSLTVPRKPGEAVGAICKLKHKDGREMTINVEYNQLDPLLRSTVSPQGDVADASGFSPYPGNINVLILACQPYAAVLAKTHGHIPEFVNPKYADGTKTKFTSPTRLESMMQDYPKCLEPSARVGFTQFERWTSFSAVKNNMKDAADKFKKTGVAESASSGEADLYYYARKILSLHPQKLIDVDVEGDLTSFGDVPVQMGAFVHFLPDFGVTTKEIHDKFVAASPDEKTAGVVISKKSTLILDARNITIGRLNLDGCLIVRAVPEAKVFIKRLTVKNQGWAFAPINPTDNAYDEKYRIRGYVVQRAEQRVLTFLQPGEYVVDED